MAKPNTTGVYRTNIKDMQTGDYIAFKYSCYGRDVGATEAIAKDSPKWEINSTTSYPAGETTITHTL